MPSGAMSTLLVDEERDLAVEQPTAGKGLDWEGFVAEYFPGSRRHDLVALAAYGRYKRSRAVAEESPTAGSRPEEHVSSKASAVDAWADEGGASP